MSNFHFLLTSPDETLIDQDAAQVLLCTTSGESTYLADHWDSIVEIDVGVIKVYLPEESAPLLFAVNGGIATFNNNKLILNTIESEKIEGKKPDFEIFPATIKAKSSKVKEDIEEALKKGGVFDENKGMLSILLAEERMAKVQLLQEIIKGR